MIKMGVLNKTNDVLIVDTFKNVFQRRSSEVFKPDVPEFGTIQKYTLHCQYSVTFCTCWLVLSMLDCIPIVCIPYIGCNNERQSFAKLSYNSVVDNVLTMLPAALQDFFQVLKASNATTTVNKLLECSADRRVHWV